MIDVEYERFHQTPPTGPRRVADLPEISVSQVETLIEGVSSVQEIGKGGQKRVFKGIIDETPYALKFSKVPPIPEDAEEEFSFADVAVRAKREVETMRECESGHMVKLGPIGLELAEVDGQQLLYFSEELIEGKDLRTTLKDDGPFSAGDVLKLVLDITDAINGIWKLRRIHRDIKPANIMRRGEGGDFVLLDAGLVFDLVGESVSVSPVGTLPYFSPEQFDFSVRRTGLDFRSDVFSLGVTMYEVATGVHPFWSRGDTSASLFNKITTLAPTPPRELVDGFPESLSDIILRMLGKSAHLRYRSCGQLIEALESVEA